MKCRQSHIRLLRTSCRFRLRVDSRSRSKRSWPDAAYGQDPKSLFRKLICPGEPEIGVKTLRGAINLYQTHSAWQLEPPRPRGARIEQQRLVEPLNFGLMRMAEDAEVWLIFLKEYSSILRELLALVHNMTDGDAAACQFDQGLGRESTLLVPIHIA